MSADPVAEANALLVERGYREPQLAVHVSPMPGRVLLKGHEDRQPVSPTRPNTCCASSASACRLPPSSATAC